MHVPKSNFSARAAYIDDLSKASKKTKKDFVIVMVTFLYHHRNEDRMGM